MKVESNIPIGMRRMPERFRIFDKLAPGDSIFFDAKKYNPSTICGYASKYASYKIRFGVRFRTSQRKENGVSGVRVWRVA